MILLTVSIDSTSRKLRGQNVLAMYRHTIQHRDAKPHRHAKHMYMLIGAITHSKVYIRP